MPQLYAAGFRKTGNCATHPGQGGSWRGHEGRYINMSDYTNKEPSGFLGLGKGKNVTYYNATDTQVNRNAEAPEPDCIRHLPSGGTHHPCRGIGQSQLILSGDGDSKAGMFGSADFGFSCEFNNAERLINDLKNEARFNTAYVIDDAGVRRTLYDQILWGGYAGGRPLGVTSDGLGFCDVRNADGTLKNMHVKVGKNGETCWTLISRKSNHADLALKGHNYCKNNRGDKGCACVNVTTGYSENEKTGKLESFLDVCERNQEWAGCKTIIKRRKEVEKLLCPNGGDKCPAAAAYGGNADCLAPGICAGTQVGEDPEDIIYPPLVALQACKTNLNICRQLTVAQNVTAAGDMPIIQSCDININEIGANRLAMKQAMEEDRKRQEREAQEKYDLMERAKAREEEIRKAAEERRKEMDEVRALDRDADRRHSAQLQMYRTLNVDRRRREMEERRAEELRRQYSRELTQIGGYDIKTVSFVVSIIFSAIFALIVASRV